MNADRNSHGPGFRKRAPARRGGLDVTVRFDHRLAAMRFPSFPAVRSICLLSLVVPAVLLLTGCGMLHGSAQIGSDLRPHLGTSISVPLGGK